MKSIPKIIREEIRKFVREYYEEEDIYSWENEIKQNVFNDFLYRNNEDFTKTTPWNVIQFPRLKKIWEDYMRTGIVRDTKGLDDIENIAITNTIKINIFTELAGHTQWGAEDDFEDNIGYWVDEQLNCILPQEPVDTSQLENPEAGHKQKEPIKVESCDVQINPFAQSVIDEFYDSTNMDREDARGKLYDTMKERFFDYFMEDPKSGQAYISDYGLKPLMTLMQQLTRTTEPEQKIPIIDKMLNVVHQRSDIAAWFVEGGSQALSQLSGYNVPEDNDYPYSDNVSAISGKYRMSDY